MLDITAYDDFLSENRITKGLIVSDKGIPATAAEERFAVNKDMHYLYPLKRSTKVSPKCHHLGRITGNNRTSKIAPRVGSILTI